MARFRASKPVEAASHAAASERARSIRFYQDSTGTRRVSIDAPGIAAVSAPIADPMAFVIIAANELGLEAEAQDDGTVIVSIPPGS